MDEPQDGEDTVQAARQDDITTGSTGARGHGGPPEDSEARGVLEGLERLFQENHRRVFKAAYRITGNASDAEDVLQTVFLRLLKRGRSAPISEALPASYLHLAAINGALDVVRGRTAARSTPLDDLVAHPPAGPSSRPDAQHGGTEMRERLRRGLARLNPRAAEVFVLRYLEGYSNLEIAHMLGKPQTLIAVTLHRARRRLRDELGSKAGGSR